MSHMPCVRPCPRCGDMFNSHRRYRVCSLCRFGGALPPPSLKAPLLKPSPQWIYVVAAKYRAIRFGVPYDCSIEVELGYPPDECPNCGVLMVSHVGEGRSGPHSDSRTVDRIIPELGYVPGNVRWLCHRCNNTRKASTSKNMR